ncbi:uncharacterized protein [Dermacentor andersoni]|uniref:uncharacterized protein isoform X2 n=1 Tax=Dermacentor andersoni TaxID=34620 RepID=UPI002416ACE4|nr:uncharacterized protein LOC126543695 isoform X2 [Dermacentor andersoni]
MAPSLRSTVKVPRRAVQLATSTSKQSSLKYKLLFRRSQQPRSDLSSQRGVSQPSNLQHATQKVPRPTGDTSTRRVPKTSGSHLKNSGDDIDVPAQSGKKPKSQESPDRVPRQPMLKSDTEDSDDVDNPTHSKKTKLQKSRDRGPRKPMLKSDTEDSDNIDDPNLSKKTKLQKSHDRQPRKPILKSDAEDFHGVDDLAKSKKPKLQKSPDRVPRKPILKSDTKDSDDIDDPNHSKETKLQESHDRGPRKLILKSDTGDVDDLAKSKKLKLQKSRDRGPQKPVLESDTEDPDNVDDVTESKKPETQESPDNVPCKPMLKIDTKGSDDADDLAQSKKAKLQKLRNTVQQKPMLMSDTEDSDDVDDPTYHKKLTSEEPHDQVLPRKPTLRSNARSNPGMQLRQPWKVDLKKASRLAGPLKEPPNTFLKSKDSLGEKAQTSKSHEATFKPISSCSGITQQADKQVAAPAGIQHNRRIMSIGLPKFRKPITKRKNSQYKCSVTGCPHTRDEGLVGFWLFPIPDKQDEPSLHSAWLQSMPVDFSINRPLSPRVCFKHFDQQKDFVLASKRLVGLKPNAVPSKMPRKCHHRQSMTSTDAAQKLESANSIDTGRVSQSTTATDGGNEVQSTTVVAMNHGSQSTTGTGKESEPTSIVGTAQELQTMTPAEAAQELESANSIDTGHVSRSTTATDGGNELQSTTVVAMNHGSRSKTGTGKESEPTSVVGTAQESQTMTAAEAAQELESENSIDTGRGSQSTTATDGVNELQSTTVVAMNHGSRSTTGTGKESEPMSIVGTAQESQTMTAAEAAQELESANSIDTGRGSRSTTATDGVNELQSATVVAMNHGSRSKTGTGKESEPMSIVGTAQESQTITAAEGAQELESANSIGTGRISQSTTTTDGGNEVQSTTVAAMNHGSQSTTGTGKESEPTSVVGTAQESQTMTAAEAAQELESENSIDTGRGSQSTTAADGGNELESMTVVAMNHGSRSISGTGKESEPISIVGTAQESQTMTAAGTNSEPHCSNAITPVPKLASDSNSKSAAELGPTFQASTELIGDNSGAGQQNKDNVCASVVSVNTGSLEEAAKYCPMVVTVSPLHTEDTNTGTCKPLPSGTPSEKCALESVSMQATNAWNKPEQQKQDISCSLVTCGPVDDAGSSTTVSHCASPEGSHDSDANADVCGLVKSVPKEMCSALTPPVLVTDNETADAMVGKLEIDLETLPQVSKDAIASSMSAQMCSASKLVDTSSDRIDKEGMKVATERHNLDPPHHVESSHRNDASITAFRTAAKVCRTLDAPAKPLFQKEVTVSNVAVLSHNLSNLVNSSNSEMNRNKQDNICKRGLPEFSAQSYGYGVQRGDGLVSSHAFNVPVAKAAVDGKNWPKVSKEPSASCSAIVRHRTDLPGGNSTEEAGKSKPTNPATASHLFDPSQGRYILKKEVLQDGDELGSSAVLCTVVWVPTRDTNP